MKHTLSLLVVLALFSASLADKHCTPSFDYCAEKLIDSQGFTEAEVEDALKGTGLRNEDLGRVLLHCTNPRQVGHPKYCHNGCKVRGEDKSHGC